MKKTGHSRPIKCKLVPKRGVYGRCAADDNEDSGATLVGQFDKGAVATHLPTLGRGYSVISETLLAWQQHQHYLPSRKQIEGACQLE